MADETSDVEEQNRIQSENNSINNSNPDDKAPLKYIFQTVDDPSHYGNIFTKENFKTLEKWGLSQNMELQQS